MYVRAGYVPTYVERESRWKWNEIANNGAMTIRYELLLFTQLILSTYV